MKVTGKNYNMETSKPSAAFTAFLKLQREYRQMVALTRPDLFQPRIEDRVAYELRCDTDTRIDTDAPPPASPATLYAVHAMAPEQERKLKDEAWDNRTFFLEKKKVASPQGSRLDAMGKEKPILEDENVHKEKPIPKQRE